MRLVIAVAALVLSMGQALAGMAPKWAEYVEKHSSINQQLTMKRDKLPKGQAAKYEAELKTSYDKMYKGMGTMMRDDYYRLADEQSRVLNTIKSALDRR